MMPLDESKCLRSEEEETEVQEKETSQKTKKEGATLDASRISAWNRWLQDRQKKLRKIKASDPLFRENEWIKDPNDNFELTNTPQEEKCPTPPNESLLEKHEPNKSGDSCVKKIPSNLIQPHTEGGKSKCVSDILHAASLAAKDGKTVSFDCFANQSNAKLSQWLEEFKPTESRKKIKDLGSIIIYGFCKDNEQLNAYKEKFDMDSAHSIEKHAPLIDEWNKMTEVNDAVITYHTICKLAKKYNVLGGKWLFSLSPACVDSVWSNVCYQINKASATASRKLKSESEMEEQNEGIPCIAAKLSPGHQDGNLRLIYRDKNSSLKGAGKSPFRGKPNFMLFVYTADFMDEKTIFEVERSLRRCGIHAQMSYKPDIFSILGIYRQNKFQLRPTIYQSHWEINHKSGEGKEDKIDSKVGQSIIDSCINQFKWASNSVQKMSDENAEELNIDTSKVENLKSEINGHVSSDGKGKLGRNIVLQVLKRKENEKNDVDKLGKLCENLQLEKKSFAHPIWIGNVPQNLSDEMIKAECETNFGPVVQIERYSFCYITFQDENSAKQLLKTSLSDGKATFCGHKLEVKEKGDEQN